MTPQSKEFLEDYAALVERVGFAPLTGRTLIAVTGPDSAQILQSFTTNDIKPLQPGQGCEAFVTSPQGKTLGHVLIFREPDKFILDTTLGQAETLIGHFQRYVITEEVEFRNLTDTLRDILVAGPDALALLKSVTGIGPPTQPYSHVLTTIAGRAVAIRRVEFLSPPSFFLQCGSDDSPFVSTQLAAAGARQCNPAALDAARLEAGTPLFGLDITPDNLPQEVNRDARAISFTKGCYLGQETVARIDAVGHVNRLLVGLRFTGDQIPVAETSLLANDQPIGHVTSAAWSRASALRLRWLF